jgi:hypothetical protein
MVDATIGLAVFGTALGTLRMKCTLVPGLIEAALERPDPGVWAVGMT